jgi:methyl-accepting chemotaxis protein
MDTWLEVFIVVAAVAIVTQAIVLVALFLQMKRLSERLERFTGDLESRLTPILGRVQLFLEDAQPKISEMIADAAHVVYLARGQAQKVDRVFTEAADRLRSQLIRADHILTGALEAVEDAGSRIGQGVWRPMRKVSAIMQGIKVGIDLLRSRRRSNRHPEEPLEQEEELFI